MSTPDETKPYGLWKLGGYSPVIVISYDTLLNGIPPIKNNRKRGFLIQGLNITGPVENEKSLLFIIVSSFFPHESHEIQTTFRMGLGLIRPQKKTRAAPARPFVGAC